MEQLTIIIPTRNRPHELSQCLKSIPDDPRISVVVGCDGDYRTKRDLKNKFPNIEFRASIHNIGSVAMRNDLIKYYCDDGVLWATDDIIFNDINIIDIYNEHFKEDEGVLGFHQRPNKYNPVGVGMAGKNFLKHYPEKKLFCEQYFHFAAHEIGFAALEREVMKMDDRVWLTHKQKYDNTAKHARKYRLKDLNLKEERKKNNLIWGMYYEATESFDSAE